MVMAKTALRILLKFIECPIRVVQCCFIRAYESAATKLCGDTQRAKVTFVAPKIRGIVNPRSVKIKN
jgi:hypothetical protein